jgi:hypothetical protein
MPLSSCVVVTLTSDLPPPWVPHQRAHQSEAITTSSHQKEALTLLSHQKEAITLLSHEREALPHSTHQVETIPREAHQGVDLSRNAHVHVSASPSHLVPKVEEDADVLQLEAEMRLRQAAHQAGPQTDRYSAYSAEPQSNDSDIQRRLLFSPRDGHNLVEPSSQRIYDADVYGRPVFAPRVGHHSDNPSSSRLTYDTNVSDHDLEQRMSHFRNIINSGQSSMQSQNKLISTRDHHIHNRDNVRIHNAIPASNIKLSPNRDDVRNRNAIRASSQLGLSTTCNNVQIHEAFRGYNQQLPTPNRYKVRIPDASPRGWPAAAAVCRCKVCGKELSSPSGLYRHMRTHSGLKPYRCSVCHKLFTQAYNLRVHGRMHTGEKPYSCRFCDKSFAWSSTLKLHLRSSHSVLG